MKKLIFVFLVLVALILVAGCKSRDTVVEFDLETKTSPVTTTVITPIEDDENAMPPKVTSVITKADEKASGTLGVKSMENGKLVTSKQYNVIRGTAPSNAHSIRVNDYTLQKFKPGDSEWVYLASAHINTLTDGENKYTVSALDGEGNVIDKTQFVVAYTAAPNTLPGVGSSLLWTVLMSALLSGVWFGRKTLFFSQNRI